MNDPYKILGVSPSSTDEEINKAYRQLAKKYHPDNYMNSPLSGLATEKMQEINQAYDQIRKQRREFSNTTSGNSNFNNNYYNNNNYRNNHYNNNSYAGYNGYAGGTTYHDVRTMIQSGRIADADQILSGVPSSNRDAEWYFLKGTILYRKGWTDQAYQHFQQACNMAPSNAEYRTALNQMMSRQNGQYGGYNTNSHNTSESVATNCATCDCGCCDDNNDGCDICTTLCCIDTCCECMGGDCIDCC